jgi:Protein of unknown function (DUF3574)
MLRRGRTGARRVPAIGAAVVVAGLLAGCAVPPKTAPRCQPMRIYNLYFGRSVAGRGAVTDAEWRAFRNEVITPNLPDGYTVLDGHGAWLNPRTHVTISESTKILEVALPDVPDSQTRIDRIRRAWRVRFHQLAVGMTVWNGRGSFSAEEKAK